MVSEKVSLVWYRTGRSLQVPVDTFYYTPHAVGFDCCHRVHFWEIDFYTFACTVIENEIMHRPPLNSLQRLIKFSEANWQYQDRTLPHSHPSDHRTMGVPLTWTLDVHSPERRGLARNILSACPRTTHQARWLSTEYSQSLAFVKINTYNTMKYNPKRKFFLRHKVWTRWFAFINAIV